MLSRAVLAICSIAFVIFGAAFAVLPRELTLLLTGGLLSAAQATDVRAIYGGMGLGLAVFFYLSLRGGVAAQRIGLLAGLWTFGLIASCRLAGILSGGASAMMLLLLASEMFGAALCAVALLALPRTATAPL